MGIGLLPVPLVDIPALIVVQLNLLRQLSRIYDIPFFHDAVRKILSSMIAGTLPIVATPALATSLVKFIPGLGQAAGALTMSAIAGASTYAIGKVFIQHFASGGTFLTFDPEKVSDYYTDMFEKGKLVVTELTAERIDEQHSTVTQAEQTINAFKEAEPTRRPTDHRTHQDVIQPSEEVIHTIEDAKKEGENIMKKNNHDKTHNNNNNIKLEITSPVLRVIIGDITVLSVVVINAFSILAMEVPSFGLFIENLFPNINVMGNIIPWIDYGCSIYFVVEAQIKIALFGFRGYWSSGWNKLDFFVVVSTLPLLMNPFVSAVDMQAFSFVSLLRLGRFLRFLRATRLLRVARTGRTLWKGAAIIEAPIFVGIILFLARLGMNSVTLPETVMFWANRIFSVALTLDAAWFLSRLFDVFYESYLIPWAEETTTTLDDILMPFAKSIVRGVVIVLGVVAALKTAGYDVGALLAGLGIGGVALAMGARDILANFLGGATLFLKRPFKISDKIQMPGFTGWVRTIDLFTTELTDLSGQVITVPNKTFSENHVVNISARSKYLIISKLHLHHDTSSEQIQQTIDILHDIVTRIEHVEETCLVSFDTIGKYSLDVEFRYAIQKYQPEQDGDLFSDEQHKIGAVKTLLNLEIMEKLNQHEIRLAFPLDMRKEFLED